VTGVSAQPGAGDTRSIYSLSAAEAGACIRGQFAGVDADVCLITGTGMPGLRLLAELTAEHDCPALNSNLCLAWHCLNSAGIALNERAPSAGFPLLGGWLDELDRL
jgi:maleate cis-trans isomerase